MSFTSTTGSRIQTARDKTGFNQSEVARRIGVKTQTLQNWENDRSEPRAEKLLRLAGVLQVPMIWLLTGDHPRGLDADVPAPDTAAIAQKLDRAVALQRDLAALLGDIRADVAHLQRQLDEDQELAA